jgi:hypothetical protein
MQHDGFQCVRGDADVFSITSGQSAQYIGETQMNFGNSDPNGLKWMAIFACNSMKQSDWSSQLAAGLMPYNSDLIS